MKNKRTAPRLRKTEQKFWVEIAFHAAFGWLGGLRDLRALRISVLGPHTLMSCFLLAVANCLWTTAAAVGQDATPSAPVNSPAESTLNRDLNSQLSRDALRLANLLESTRAKHGVPAMWGVVLRDGAMASVATGVRKMGEPDLAEVDDLIHLGSCTKAMTAALVATFIADGKLQWDSTLAEIFANVPQLQDSEWGSVTVEQLLQHRSGAPANAPWFEIDGQHQGDAIAGRRAVLVWLTKQRRPTQSRFLYSNVGYALLGHVAEQISAAELTSATDQTEHEDWRSLVRSRVLEPLEITSAGFGPVLGADGSQPWGHAPKPQGLGAGLYQLLGGSAEVQYEPNRLDNPPTLGPAGRIHMQIDDWLKFVQLLANDSLATSKLNISPEVWRRLLTPMDAGAESGQPYAGGWLQVDRDWAGGTAYTHAGSNNSWYCVAWVAPNEKFIALAAANTAGDAAALACDEWVASLVAPE